MSTPKSHSPMRRVVAAGLAAALLALGGCAAMQPKAPEQVVEQRVEERWAALIAGNYDKAWTYTQPSFRDLVKQANYRGRFGGAGEWRGVQVHSVTCAAERCEVRLRLTTRVMVPPFAGHELVGAIDEVWIREDGQWWYFEAL